MACSDCDECSSHVNHGGICNRYEYDCVFRHLHAYNDEESKKVLEDYKTAIELKTEISSIYEKYQKVFHDGDNYELDSLKKYIMVLDDLVDKDLEAEWKKISLFDEKRRLGLILRTKKVETVLGYDYYKNKENDHLYVRQNTGDDLKHGEWYTTDKIGGKPGVLLQDDLFILIYKEED